jgi:hypothetical protein
MKMSGTVSNIGSDPSEFMQEALVGPPSTQETAFTSLSAEITAMAAKPHDGASATDSADDAVNAEVAEGVSGFDGTPL